MGTISLSYIYFNFLRDTERETLAAFARDDGCYKVYKFAMQPGGPKDHALPVRSASDEQGLFGSQHVHDPVCIWPPAERSEPLRSHLERVTLSGDTLDQARESVPPGYKIIFEQIASTGEPRTVSESGKTPKEAEQKAWKWKSKVSNGRVISANLVTDYQFITVQVTASSSSEARDLARAVAKGKGLKSFTMEERMVGATPEKRGPELFKITVDAPDEAGAVAQGVAAGQAKGFADPHAAARLVTPGKKGFLGLGAKPNQYEVTVVQPALYDVEITQSAEFEIVYEDKARIDAIIGM